MAKRPPKNGEQQELADWGDKYPAEVQDAADDYDKAHSAKSKAQGKLNTAKDVLVDKMQEHQVPRVRIRNGEKFLVIDSTNRIKYEKPAEE
jgi:hypothetical protein